MLVCKACHFFSWVLFMIAVPAVFKLGYLCGFFKGYDK